MSRYIFVFDLDSTITNEEILPKIAQLIGKEESVRNLTEQTMSGEIPFKHSFISRVEILKNIKISTVQELIKNIALNKGIARFIKENVDRCYIVTGNLDVWIRDLMVELGMESHCFCSKASISGEHLGEIVSVLDKKKTVSQFVQPLVVVGDGDNDAEMAQLADVAIGFGGVRTIAKSLQEVIDFAFYDDELLYNFLTSLL